MNLIEISKLNTVFCKYFDNKLVLNYIYQYILNTLYHKFIVSLTIDIYTST